MLGHHGIVRAAAAQEAAVHLGMQGLDAPVHHLRETGVFGYVLHREPRIPQQLGGATGGEQFDAEPAGAGEIQDTGFIGNA